jgi:hypothetical protein
MPKRAIGSQITFAIGEGTEIPLTPERIRQEMADLAEFIITGGPVGAAGPIDSVIGVRGIFSYAISVDAPEATWNVLQDKTVPAEAEIDPPAPPNRQQRRAAERAGLKWNPPTQPN